MTERQIREDERRRIGALLREAADEDDGRSAQAKGCSPRKAEEAARRKRNKLTWPPAACGAGRD